MDLACNNLSPLNPRTVAAGVRCTLANTAYTPGELGYQYDDSSARIVLTSEDGLATVQEMFKARGLTQKEANKRIILMTRSLDWAGGPAVKVIPEATDLVKFSDLLTLGTLDTEEKFDGQAVDETVYLCYSSGVFFVVL